MESMQKKKGAWKVRKEGRKRSGHGKYAEKEGLDLAGESGLWLVGLWVGGLWVGGLWVGGLWVGVVWFAAQDAEGTDLYADIFADLAHTDGLDVGSSGEERLAKLDAVERISCGWRRESR